MHESEQRPTEQQPDDASHTPPHGDPALDGSEDAGPAGLADDDGDDTDA